MITRQARPSPAWALALCLTISTTFPLAAADWPQWRGPARTGFSTETNLLQSWPAGGPPLAWKAAALGKGYSGVSISAGRIFTMGDGPDASYLRALDEKTGRPLWATKLGKTGGGGGYPGPRSTPTVDAALVYGLNQHGDLLCAEVASGAERWRRNLRRDFGGEVGGWDYAESPLVDGSKLVVAPGGRQGAIVALNKLTGEKLWQTRNFTDRVEYSSIITAELGGVRQYILLTQQSVVGVSPQDGSVLWFAPRKGDVAVIPTPIAHDGHVYVTSGYGVGCNLFRVESRGGRFEAREVYANKEMVNHHGGVIRLGDHLYGYSDGSNKDGARAESGWTCQTLKTGEVIWRDRRKLGKGSIAYADGRFYLRGESGKGTLVLIEATPKGFVEHGRFDQPDRSDKNSWPHPVIANGRLYVRDQDVLLCYDVTRK
jgi:outer membrane protein assembly factor BamB